VKAEAEKKVLRKRNAEAQAAFRRRRDERLARMEAALKTIAAELEGSDDPIDKKIRKIVLTGLG